MSNLLQELEAEIKALFAKFSGVTARDAHGVVTKVAGDLQAGESALLTKAAADAKALGKNVETTIAPASPAAHVAIAAAAAIPPAPAPAAPGTGNAAQAATTA